MLWTRLLLVMPCLWMLLLLPKATSVVLVELKSVPCSTGHIMSPWVAPASWLPASQLASSGAAAW
jgi:hypothetical protein